MSSNKDAAVSPQFPSKNLGIKENPSLQLIQKQQADPKRQIVRSRALSPPQQKLTQTLIHLVEGFCTEQNRLVVRWIVVVT